jgi:hypothetical protein
MRHDGFCFALDACAKLQEVAIWLQGMMQFGFKMNEENDNCERQNETVVNVAI